MNTPLNKFTTLVVQQNGLIAALEASADPYRLMVNMSSVESLHSYLNINLPKIGVNVDGLVSVYLFAKSNSKEKDHRWNPGGKCLYLIQVVTSRQQSVVAYKIIRAIYQSNRINPNFTLALDPYNSGFAIHKDIYHKTEDFSFYTFNYVLEDKAKSLEDYSLESPFTQLHHFQATEEEKSASKYFYLELTNSPNEVNGCFICVFIR